MRDDACNAFIDGEPLDCRRRAEERKVRRRLLIVQAIETVLFDFGGTLDSDGVPSKERFHALYVRKDWTLRPRLFAPLFYAADDALVGALAYDARFEETVDIGASSARTRGRRGGEFGER